MAPLTITITSHFPGRAVILIFNTIEFTFCLLWSICKWNHKVLFWEQSDFFCLTLNSCNSAMLFHLVVRSSFSFFYSIPWYEYSQFIYPFYCWWVLGYFQFGAITNSTAKYTSVHSPLWCTEPIAQFEENLYLDNLTLEHSNTHPFISDLSDFS